MSVGRLVIVVLVKCLNGSCLLSVCCVLFVSFVKIVLLIEFVCSGCSLFGWCV